jgi:hypothetical protein
MSLSSNYLGRNMDLAVVAEEDLALGQTRIEEKAQEMIAAQARRWGFSEETYLRLVRLAYNRDAKVDLAELEGSVAAVKLLKPHLPSLTKAMVNEGLLAELAAPVMAAVLDFTPIEGTFWERFFSKLRFKLRDDAEAATALAWHLTLRPRRLERCGPGETDRGGWPKELRRVREQSSQTLATTAGARLPEPGSGTNSPTGQSPGQDHSQALGQERGPELGQAVAQDGPKGLGAKGFYLDFAGEMAPFHSLESMDHLKAVSFLESFISKTWGRDYSKSKKKGIIVRPLPRGPEPRRLATDLVQVAHLNRLPRTLMMAMLHADFETSGLWPSTLELYGWGQRLTDLLYALSSNWSETKPRLLDFDLLYEYLTSITKSNTLEKCHHRLYGYLLETQARKPDLLETTKLTAQPGWALSVGPVGNFGSRQGEEPKKA